MNPNCKCGGKRIRISRDRRTGDAPWHWWQCDGCNKRVKQRVRRAPRPSIAELYRKRMAK